MPAEKDLSREEVADVLMEEPTQYVMLSKNHCHHPLMVPSTKEMGFGIIEDDRVLGIFNGTNLYEDEFTGESKGWKTAAGYTMKKVRDLREKHPDVKAKFGRGLQRFDMTVLLSLLGAVQHRFNIQKKIYPDGNFARDHRLHFPSLYSLGKFLGLPETTQYYQRLKVSLVRLAASSCWFNGTYYDWKQGKVLENDIIGFHLFDYFRLNKVTGEVEIDLSPRWVEAQEGYTVKVYFDDVKTFRSEIDLNLLLMLRAWDDKPIKRELLELCQGLGLNNDGPKTEMRKNIKSSISSINEKEKRSWASEYSVTFKEKKGKEVVSISRPTHEELLDENNYDEDDNFRPVR